MGQTQPTATPTPKDPIVTGYIFLDVPRETLATVLVAYHLDDRVYTKRPRQTISSKLTDTSTTISMANVAYRIGSQSSPTVTQQIGSNVAPLITWNPTWDNNDYFESATYTDSTQGTGTTSGIQGNGLGVGAFAYTLTPTQITSLNIRSNNDWVSDAAIRTALNVFMYCSATTMNDRLRGCPNAAEGQSYDTLFKTSFSASNVYTVIPEPIEYREARPKMSSTLLDLGNAWSRQLFNPNTNSLTDDGKIVMSSLFGSNYATYFRYYDINPVGGPPPLDPLETGQDELLECGDGTSDCLGEQEGVMSWQVFSTARDTLGADLPGVVQWFGLIIVVVIVGVVALTAFMQFPGQTAISYSWGALCIVIIPSVTIGGLIPFVWTGLFYAIVIVGGLLTKMGRWSQ